MSGGPILKAAMPNRRKALPIACAAVEQALHVANVGPLTPNSIPTWAEADEPMKRSKVRGWVARFLWMKRSR